MKRRSRLYLKRANKKLTFKENRENQRILHSSFHKSFAEKYSSDTHKKILEYLNSPITQ